MFRHPIAEHRLFLDTADTEAWRSWLPTGLFFGVTTNPTLLKRADVPCTFDRLEYLCSCATALGASEVHMQVWGETAQAMETCGRTLAAIDPRVVVKVPVTRSGVEAASRLIERGVRITMTAVYAPHQAMIAAAIGASYAAPYFGRMNDAGRDGLDSILKMQSILGAGGLGTRLLVASLRSLDDVMTLAANGLETFTFSPGIAQAMFEDPLTETAARAFEADARENMKSDVEGKA